MKRTPSLDCNMHAWVSYDASCPSCMLAEQLARRGDPNPYTSQHFGLDPRIEALARDEPIIRDHASAYRAYGTPQHEAMVQLVLSLVTALKRTRAALLRELQLQPPRRRFVDPW